MIPLAVNPRGLEWQAVVSYIRARRAELVEQAIDIQSPEQSRLVAAARIAELDEMLTAPGRTMEVAVGEATGKEVARSIY